MAMHEWVPDKPPRSSEQEKSSAPTSYIIVSPLHPDKDTVSNIAGWSDLPPGDTFACKICKKQLHAEFLGLAIFPSFKADTDLFQFAYAMPQHKVGGTFSNEICEGSRTNVIRDFERPTCIRFLAGDQTATDVQGEESAQAAEPVAPETKEDPLAVLKIRLAKGEITEQEFGNLVKIVGEGESPAPEAPHEEVDQKASMEELKKRLDSLSPQMAEERYEYLSAKRLGELTDAEYEERLALVERLSKKHTDTPKKKSK